VGPGGVLTPVTGLESKLAAVLVLDIHHLLPGPVEDADDLVHLELHGEVVVGLGVLHADEDGQGQEGNPDGGGQLPRPGIAGDHAGEQPDAGDDGQDDGARG